ncbi:MAG: biotin/lipoyl-containing protein, partial [Acidimicrobiales bacterium]
MADITMPQLGETVTEGTIIKWHKQVGDQVAADEVLFEVSTDKVDSEVPSSGSGYLAEILVPEGATVDVGTTIAVLAPEAPGTPGGGGTGAEAEPPPAAEPPAAAAPPPPAAEPPA